ncbi:MAG: hypothetical protein P4L81_00545, partial [Candidatus Pacebacteria bacterium]|nr:hypothetical protein [Candidatus Paceibacterota bacterium]
MTMTAFQREGLQLLGYTRRESEFLFLVATHSGYFTNRQFKYFAETESGSVSHAFIHKLLDRQHASYHAYRSGGRVYHLFARKVYQAIERENLRTRKKHELEYVKTRLVALDFILGHPKYRYLETEAEKVAIFEKECGVSRETLPVKQYRARRSAEITPRYFVDRFPMFVDREAALPTVTFTYVDAGAITLEAFGTHLRAYLGLFQALPKLEFIYLSPTARLFQAAESEFRHVLYGARGHANSANPIDYFRVRKAWEAKERVASSDVILLKEAQARFAGHQFEELYEKWRSGATTDAKLDQIVEQARSRGTSVFRTII